MCLSLKTIRSSLIINSGMSVCITPFKTDFVSYKPSTVKIKDLSSSNQVTGKGGRHRVQLVRGVAQEPLVRGSNPSGARVQWVEGC